MARARTELIHCDNCGEDYADTYRRCPFCNAKAGRKQEGYDDTDYAADDGHRGGKRLAGGSKGGGNGHPVKTALYILSALVILAAIWIMCTTVIPKILDLAPAGESPSPNVPAVVVPSVEPSTEPSAKPSPEAEPSPSYTTELPSLGDDPLALDSPDLPPVETDTLTSQAPASNRPDPSASPAPSAAATAALRLSSTDFTLSPRYPTYQLEIAGVGRAMATYSVKNEAVATVNSTGLITAVGDGNTTLTVTDDKGNTATAIVRVSGMSGGQTSTSESPASETPASQAPASTGSARLNKTDFSITASFPDPYRLRVTDGEAASWSSKNESIATVSGDGTVTGVGNGTTTITCTLTDGAKLTCTVHVSGK